MSYQMCKKTGTEVMCTLVRQENGTSTDKLLLKTVHNVNVVSS